MGSTNLLTFGLGLAAVTGEQHTRQRKMLNPAFSTKHLRSTIPVMYTVAYRVYFLLTLSSKVTDSCLLAQLRDAISQRVTEETIEIDMLTWMSRTAMELVAQAGLGCSLDSLKSDEPGTYFVALKSLM